MKRIAGVVCALLLCSGLAAQIKVIEKSSKKIPAWLVEVNEDYLVVTVNAQTLGDAQTAALSEITQRIIQSVASHVTVSQESSLSEENVNGNIDTRSTFSHVAKMQSANLPFLKGISLSRAVDVYWQRVRDKDTGREYYDYSVLYPFSREEQQTLLAQFEALDAEQVALYEKLEKQIDNIASVDEIKGCITQLDALCEYFFDDVRLNRAKGLRDRYRQLYDALSVTGEFLGEGEYRCQVLLKGKPVAVSTLPRVTSNCAAQVEVRPSDGAFIITYDAIDCLPEEENFLDIFFRIGGKRLSHKAYLKAE